MKVRTTYALAAAGLLVGIGGCASSSQSGSTNPGAQGVSTNQQESQQALEHAREAQKKAADQEQKAAAARADVQKLQRQLTQARDEAQQEQQKAMQLQHEANQETRAASAQAQQSQQQAGQALSRAGEHMARNLFTTQGEVMRSSSSELVVQPQNGQQVRFNVTPRTDVVIDGQRASASDIRQGEDALVSYEMSGAEPSAIKVQIVTGNIGLGQGAGAGSSSGPSQGSGGSNQ